ncbi:hypothetical protein HOE37_00805 [Candidatus Woesearchaeota archaeon]|jgi:hypothetical protein|nr:hypothetical protein [Candidatus Woesearchaeota archaeon]MBT4110375.1 hypothetical protein [Candidatus Woesearchaeota archaeon]MBT4336101.1 hypothetical protein [Candidatus Woesearchaeota archaeon]MBT4468920.1 hypothetical protein [Candidatus Woesearchaeota archaeon]MBT6744761.1 hypothetical protein [Candidatus Woesearchaeota archaeon]
MGLVNEAGYLYVHSKELLVLNKRIKRLSKKAKKHVDKHTKAETEGARSKHKKKHTKTTEDIHSLMKKHNKVLIKLKAHQIAYIHALRKEHKV